MTENTQKHLIFTLSGKRYAFDLVQVAEVIENPAAWPIPLAPACYLGAINFHGTIVAVLDLALFLGHRQGYGTGKVIVLDTRIAALAISAESIIRITPLGQAVHSAVTVDEPFALGQLDLPEGQAILLDAAAIAEHATETING
jgi:chemotaxis signal transduction protein